MAMLRLGGSALLGASVAVCLFAAMGSATAPGTVYQETLSAFPELEWQSPGRIVIENGSASWRTVSKPVRRPPPVVMLVDDSEVTHPGFITETVIDPYPLDLEIVVMSRRLSTTPGDAERRWWRTLFSEIAKN